MKKSDYERGRIQNLVLEREIELNGNTIKSATIELDHINFGLDKKTNKLKRNRRTNFSLKDIGKFILLLDGEYIPAVKYEGQISTHQVRIDCPIIGNFLGKQFLMIFRLDYRKADQIYTLTLYPIRSRK